MISRGLIVSIVLSQNNSAVLCTVTSDGTFPAFLWGWLSVALVYEQEGLLHPEHRFRGLGSDLHHETRKSRS